MERSLCCSYNNKVNVWVAVLNFLRKLDYLKNTQLDPSKRTLCHLYYILDIIKFIAKFGDHHGVLQRRLIKGPPIPFSITSKSM